MALEAVFAVSEPLGIRRPAPTSWRAANEGSHFKKEAKVPRRERLLYDAGTEWSSRTKKSESYSSVNACSERSFAEAGESQIVDPLLSRLAASQLGSRNSLSPPRNRLRICTSD